MLRTTLLSLGTILAAAGCEKLPELPLGGTSDSVNRSTTDLVGHSASDPSPPPSPKTDPSAQVANTPSKPVQPPTPEQIINAFRQKKTTRLTETDILELAGLETGLDQIEELDLKGSRLSPAAMSALAKFTGLKKLDLQAASFGGGHLQGISTLPALEWLDLSRTATNNVELEHVAQITTLKVLKLNQTVINDAGIGQFTKLAALEELDISGTETVGLGLAALGKEGAKSPLKIIRASHTRLGAQGFRFVNQFSLEELHASKAMVTDLSVMGLKGCTKLKVLNLSNNLLTDRSAKWLVSSKILEEIDLSGNRGISDGTILKLQTLSALSKLDLTKTGSSAKGIQRLKKKLPDCTVKIDGRTL